eukprot:gene7582-11906_t
MIVHITRENPTNYPYSNHLTKVTSLAKSQLSKNFDVSIILPRYTSNIQFFRDEKKITEINWNHEKISVYLVKYGEIKFYRIGHGVKMPLDTIWDSKEKTFKEKSLRELFFSICTTKLILQIYLGELKFEKHKLPRNIEYVHIHGAIDGLIGLQLKKYMGSELRPSIILTLHGNDIYHDKLIAIEYLDQFQVSVVSVYPIFPSTSVSTLKIGLSVADAITCTSVSLYNELIYGSIDFKYRDILMKLNEQELFIGIPFAVSDELSLSNVAYRLGVSTSEEVSSLKETAKTYIFNNKIIQDDKLPLVIYISGVDSKESFDLFKYIPKLSTEIKFNFLILRNSERQEMTKQNFEELQKIHNHQNIKLLDIETSMKHGLAIRAAADFVFSPSMIAGNSMNVAELQSFGVIPICTKSGGHKDLVSTNKNKQNGYLFKKGNREHDTYSNMRFAFLEAIGKWNRMTTKEKNRIRKLNYDSTIYWSSNNNPLNDFLNLYKHSERHVSRSENSEENFKDQFYSQNFVQNSLFDPSLKSWMPYFVGFEYSKENGIKLTSNEGKAGATQIVRLDQNYPRKVVIGGWSRAEFVSGDSDANYAITADINFRDKTVAKNFFIPFSTGTHGWELKYYSISFEKPIQNIILTLLFHDHTGTVYFDRIYVVEEFERK